MVHHPPQLALVRDGGAPSHCAAFECAEIIRHDMPWNPARLKQRNGRIDHVASLSKARGCHVRIGVPFLEQSYERWLATITLAGVLPHEGMLPAGCCRCGSLSKSSTVEGSGHVVEGVGGLQRVYTASRGVKPGRMPSR